jgi:hypothetical protein
MDIIIERVIKEISPMQHLEKAVDETERSRRRLAAIRRGH